MNTEITAIHHSATELGAVSPRALALRAKQITEAMESIFIKNVHYGTIPGTDKPTLYKPGAEKLLLMFQISVDPEVQDLSTDDVIRYRVRAIGRHIPTGNMIGVGIGECSSAEAKYAWRAALSDEEYEDTDPELRREKYGKANNRIYKTQQIATNPADQANTVLKMAKKRAMTDLCLTALGASDAFEQDLEDMEDGSIRQRQKKPHTDKPQATGGTAQSSPAAAQSTGQSSPDGATTAQAGAAVALATQAQVKLLKRRVDLGGIRETDFFKRYEITAFEELPFARVNDALAWVESVATG